MSRKFGLARFLLLSIVLLLSSHGQSYTLKKVTVVGSKRFAEPDILQVINLKPGNTISAEDLKQAANRLTESGVFAQVNYTFDGLVAEYTVADAEQFVPATFENFVWLSEAELAARLHDSVSLFAGNIPLTGNLSDQICTTLDSILKEKGVPGHAVAKMTPPTGPAQAVQFQVEGINVQIYEIRFPGANATRLQQLQAETKSLVGTTYFQSPVAIQLRQACLRVYGKLGFLKAQFAARRFVLSNSNPAQPEIALEVVIQEGDPYTFSSADWSGNQVFSTADLMKLVDLKPSGPADSVRLAGDIAAAKELYGSKGYMYAQIKSSATLDASDHTAVFHLAVQEGPLYHMGKLELQSLNQQQADLVRRVWELHEGDAYDASYPKIFLKKHPHELQVLNGWGAVFTQTIHDDTLAVDLTLKFQKLEEASR
jgi:outer membrane protein insertion porin family